MNPKKIKTIKLDEDPSKDQEFVNDCFDFYWSQVRKDITSITYSRINVEGLGIFQIKSKALDDTLRKYRNGLNKLDATKFSKYPRYEGIKKRLVLLENARLMLDAELERKKTIKESKNGSTNTNMEEQR